MADEHLFVESFITLTNLSGDPSDITGDPTEPNTENWLEADDLDSNVEMVGAFEVPSADLDGEQILQARLRGSANDPGDNPSFTFELREGSTVVETFFSNESVTQNQDGELFEGFFDASDISDPTAVEIGINGESTGGKPGTRDTVEIGRTRWAVGLDQFVDVSTLAPTDVSVDEARFNGSVEFAALDVDVWFEWGEVGAGFPNTTPTQSSVGQGNFDELVTGLDANTEYEYRAHADGDTGTATDTGGVMTFTTVFEISGVVTAGGSPADGAKVIAVNNDGVFAAETTTNASGEYVLEVAGGHEYHVAAQHEDGDQFAGESFPFVGDE